MSPTEPSLKNKSVQDTQVGPIETRHVSANLAVLSGQAVSVYISSMVQ